MPKQLDELVAKERGERLREIESKTRSIVYRMMWNAFVNGQTVPPEKIDEMVQRVIRDMGF